MICNIFNRYKGKNIEVKLKSGDMLLYSDCELEHWRNIFKGKYCSQFFYITMNRIKKIR